MGEVMRGIKVEQCADRNRHGGGQHGESPAGRLGAPQSKDPQADQEKDQAQKGRDDKIGKLIDGRQRFQGDVLFPCFPIHEAHDDRNSLSDTQLFQGCQQVPGIVNLPACHRDQLIAQLKARRLQRPLMPGFAGNRFVQCHGLFEESADKGILQPAIRCKQGHDKDNGRQDLIHQDNVLRDRARDGIEPSSIDSFFIKGNRKRSCIAAYEWERVNNFTCMSGNDAALCMKFYSIALLKLWYFHDKPPAYIMPPVTYCAFHRVNMRNL